jgi:hypothetical protein
MRAGATPGTQAWVTLALAKLAWASLVLVKQTLVMVAAMVPVTTGAALPTPARTRTR